MTAECVTGTTEQMTREGGAVREMLKMTTILANIILVSLLVADAAAAVTVGSMGLWPMIKPKKAKCRQNSILARRAGL